jgi:glycosyltransferase involved in cell wall biosynthesis
MKKIRVLHLVEALGGGVYSYFIDLSSYFGNLTEIETTIIYSDKRNEIIPEKIKTDFHSKVKLIRVPIEKNISPFKDAKAIFSFYKIILHEKPDIIHLHSSKAGVIGRFSYFFSMSKAKLFYSPHGYSFLRQDISSSKRRIYYMIEKNIQKIFGGVTIACGDTEYDYANEMGKSLLVRNGVNIQELRIHNKPFNNHLLTVGILGRITFARNPKMFNEIAKSLPNIRFKWIGDGELRNEINAKNIEVTGWFTDRKIGLKHLNDIDIYLQTSLWEGLPISLLEAMALEKPIIATDVIGNRDIVVHNINGFLFETEQECVNYILKLIDPKLRLKFGSNGRKRCAKLFDVKKNFKQLASIYLS